MRVHLPFLQREIDFVTSSLPPWTTRPFKKGVYSIRGKRSRVNIFLQDPSSIEKGGENENGRVASLSA